MKRKTIMTDYQRLVCEKNADIITYYRNNPCIAAKDLLGINLFDAQKYILQMTWNVEKSLWTCTRNFGKTFLIAILALLKAMLYPNQAIYIISSVGDQAKETFNKIEEIVTGIGKTAQSIESLKDIAAKETVKSPTNKDGFSHGSSGYEVSFYNGSSIYTLNSKPDNARSRRATMVIFDEAAFCSDELIAVCEAFAMQESDFVTSVKEGFSPEALPLQIPTQIVYASSMDSVDKLFYKKYKDFSIRMFSGDRRYFVCDMICETAMQTFMNGEPYKPLIPREKVDSELRSNKLKALREYYNEPTRDGGANQIIKWGTIRRNENFYLPTLTYDKDSKIAMAFDPARTGDNSIVTAMKIYEDEELGLCGDIVNCVNMVDTASARHYKLDSKRQIDILHEMLLSYNGKNPDYENIDVLLIDAGSGGGGVSTYADSLLSDWTDASGKTHRGLIDTENELYAGYESMYPNAVDKLRLLSPRKFKTKMVEEFIELMELGVLRFPFEFKGGDTICYYENVKGESVRRDRALAVEEILALENIDLLKYEITSIHRYNNAENTAVSYALSREKENKVHDDRFYTVIMLAHRLHELRRKTKIMQNDTETDYSNVRSCITTFTW